MLNMEFSSFWDIFAIPFGYVMQFFNMICKDHYALSLLLFALVVKLVLLPLSIKQQKNQIKGAMLRPKMALIEKKYAGRTDKATLQKKQQELMDMQQKEGYSPLSGCLPLLIQFPVIISLYRIIRMPLKYVCGLSDKFIIEIASTLGGDTSGSLPQDQIALVEKIRANNGFTSASDLGSITVDQLPNFKLFGRLDLSFNPSFKVDALGGDATNLWLLLIPALCCGLAFLTTFVSKKFNDPTAGMSQTKEQQSSMAIMNFAMPLMTLWIAFVTSAAVGLYWVYTSLLGLLQIILFAKWMPLPTYTEEEIRAIQKEMKAAEANGTRTITGTSVDANGKPKSLHNVDDDDEY